jgi:transposase
MIGFQTDHQKRIFYFFDLENHVPQNHLLRGINQHLDLSNLRQHLAEYYSHTGRPSIDPELMIRMLIIGYSFGIRSERRLCEEVHLNLAYCWFCRLTPSMSRRGNCYDNAVVESFFSSLKKERVKRKIYPTREEAKTEIFEYIEVFYNRTRRHSYLNQLSPMAFEQLQTGS